MADDREPEFRPHEKDIADIVVHGGGDDPALRDSSINLYRFLVAVAEGKSFRDHNVSSALVPIMDAIFRSHNVDVSGKDSIDFFRFVQREGPRSILAARFHLNLGTLLAHRGERSEARTHLERARVVFEKNNGREDPDVAECIDQLARLAVDEKDFVTAERLYRQSLAIRTRVSGPDHPYTARARHNLSVLLNARGQHDQARRLYHSALPITLQNYGPDHQISRKVVNFERSLGDEAPPGAFSVRVWLITLFVLVAICIVVLILKAWLGSGS